MDLRRLAPFIKLALYLSELYFLYSSISLLLYSPKTTYVVLHGSTKGITGFHACLLGEDSDCPPGLRDAAALRKLRLEFKRADKSADRKGLENKNEHGKQKGMPVAEDERNSPGGHKERAKQGVYGYGRAVNEMRNELSIDFLKHSLDAIANIINEIVKYDPNRDRSLKARQGVMNAVFCYEKLLAQERKKEETAYDVLISKIKQGLAQQKIEL